MDGSEQEMYWWYVTLDEVSAIGWQQQRQEISQKREQNTESANEGSA